MSGLIRTFLVRFCHGLLLVAGAAEVAGQEVQRFPVHESNGSDVAIEHLFSLVPPGGFTSVRITVNNKGKEVLPAVLLSTGSSTPAGRNQHRVTGSFPAFSVGPETSVTKEIIVPLMMNFSTRYGYEESNLEVSVGGVGRSVEAGFRSSNLLEMPFVAVSQGVIGKSLVPLNEEARRKAAGSGSSYGREGAFLSTFLPSHLSADWRVYAGVDVLGMSADEWLALSPAVRAGVRQWVIFGGLLDLYHTGTEPSAMLLEMKADAEAKGGRHSLGRGGVRFFAWDGKDLPVGALVNFEMDKRPGAVAGNRRLEAGNAFLEDSPPEARAGLADSMGVRSFAAWQVGVILVLFGILVGPVNLFYFAAPGRRHRLFFTTPLIAVATSLLLLAVIFLQDGAGGQGRRAALVELRPEENNAFIRQYQISRTGVLFGGGFVVDAAAVVTPLMLKNSRWTRLKPVAALESEGQRYNMPDPLGFAGDWFQSRSEQAQCVEGVRPGRGRFELQPGGGDPVVVSSFPARVERLYYEDLRGDWWASQGLITAGSSTPLHRVEAAEAAAWIASQLAFFPPRDRELVPRPGGRFYALSRDPAAGLISTLTSIHWDQDHLFLHGPLAPAP